MFLKVFNFIVFLLLIFSMFKNSQKLKFHILSMFYTPTMENLHFYSCSLIFRSSGQKGQKMLWGKKTDHLQKVNFKKTAFYFSFIFVSLETYLSNILRKRMFCQRFWHQKRIQNLNSNYIKKNVKNNGFFITDR